MAKFHSLIDALNGKGLSGTIGDKVYYQRNGISYSRSKPMTRKDSRTPAQLVQREKFSVILRFLKPLKEFIRIGFRSKAKNMSEFNYATSFLYKNALTRDYPDFSVDYSRVRLSAGKLAAAIEPKITLLTGYEIEFTWQVHPWEADCYRDDRAMIVVHNIEKQEAIVITNGNLRESMHQLVTLPETYKGDEIVCYLAFRDDGKKNVSDSQYVGCLKVDEAGNRETEGYDSTRG